MRKPLPILLLLVGLLACAPRALCQAAQQRERIQASYLLAFGRTANEAEVSYWAKQSVPSVAQLVSMHQQYLARDPGTHRDAIKRAYNDAMGRNPTEAEIKYWATGVDTYSTLVKNHVAWLGGNPGEYEAVIRRSYQFALHRPPNADEIRYWKSQGTLSYLMLVACHQDWAHRNGNNVPKTSGGLAISASAPVLSVMLVSPAIANEARGAAGLVSTNGGNVIAAGGGNLIGDHGSEVVGPGGASVIAAGGGNVIAAGGGN